MPVISSSVSPVAPELWRKRLIYRSHHRGCKETDLLLGGYCDRHLLTLSEAEMAVFEALLEEEDADIWNWVTGKTPCPHPQYTALLDAMRAHSA